MHACGHAHAAILMGVVEFLAKNKAHLKGKIMFIFQPAEEGPPEGEGGGAEMMLAEGIRYIIQKLSLDCINKYSERSFISNFGPSYGSSISI